MFGPRSVLMGCFLLCGLGTAGCAEKSTKKPVFPVHGRVTFEGKPVSRATIMFSSVDPNDRGVNPNTSTDADGRFTLTSYTSGDGAPAGEYVVGVLWPGPKGKAKQPVDPGEDPDESAAPDQLKGKYWPVPVSKLRVTVKAEPDNEINIALP